MSKAKTLNKEAIESQSEEEEDSYMDEVDNDNS